jgi:CheY-like chemotaxis protein
MIGFRRAPCHPVAMPIVLIVEDDYDFRELERTLLQTHGYTVITAANGAEALSILQTQQPCVILLDLMMPIMDGLTFLRECEGARGTTKVAPVICVTAGGKDLAAEAVRRGAAHCLPKPTDLDELCETVDRFCRTGG